MRLFAFWDTCWCSIADCHWFMPLIVIHDVVGGLSCRPSGRFHLSLSVPAPSPSLRRNLLYKSRADVSLIKRKSKSKSNQTKSYRKQEFFATKQHLMICLCPGNGLPHPTRGWATSCSSFHFSFAFLWPPTQTACVVASNLSHVSINLA